MPCTRLADRDAVVLVLVPCDWIDHRAILGTLCEALDVRPVGAFEDLRSLRLRGLIEQRLARAEDGSLTYQVRRAEGVA